MNIEIAMKAVAVDLILSLKITVKKTMKVRLVKAGGCFVVYFY